MALLRRVVQRLHAVTQPFPERLRALHRHQCRMRQPLLGRTCPQVADQPLRQSLARRLGCHGQVVQVQGVGLRHGVEAPVQRREFAGP